MILSRPVEATELDWTCFRRRPAFGRAVGQSGAPYCGMSYVRAFSSLGCPGSSLDEVLTLAARHQVAAVELRSLGGTLDLSAYFAKLHRSPAALADRLRDSPVRIAAFDTGLHLVDPAPGEREKFLEFLPWAEALGVRWLRVFDGGKSAGTEELARAAEAMDWWRTTRRAHGWQADLMIETHDSLFTAGAIGRFLALVPDAAILWDSHHTWKRGGEDPVVTWQAIKSQVVHIHVKDSVSRPGANHPYTYVLPGTGEFPMTALRQVLHAEYSGPLSLEWEKLWHPALPSLDEALNAATERGWW